MSFFERILVFLGLAEEMEDEEYYYDEEELDSAGDEMPAGKTRVDSNATPDEPNHEKDLNQGTSPVVPLRGERNKMSKIYLLVPEQFEQAQQVGKFLKQGVPVIVNLKELDKANAKQFIDFISGTIFALDGSLHKINHQVFLFSPSSVVIEGEIAALEEVDLFDMDDTLIKE